MKVFCWFESPLLVSSTIYFSRWAKACVYDVYANIECMGVSITDALSDIDMTKTKNQLKTNDKIIRQLLLNELEIKYGSDSSVRVIEELGLDHGAARIDIAVLNGVMHGYEIKSDADTLYRLPSQINAYNSVFSRMTIVVGSKHLEHVINLVPEWWEIILVRQHSEMAVSMYQIRDGLTNKNQDNEAIARLLWKEEALDVLRECNAVRGVASQPRSVVYERLARTLDTATLQKRVRDIIFARGDWRADPA